MRYFPEIFLAFFMGGSLLILIKGYLDGEKVLRELDEIAHGDTNAMEPTSKLANSAANVVERGRFIDCFDGFELERCDNGGYIVRFVANVMPLGPGYTGRRDREFMRRSLIYCPSMEEVYEQANEFIKARIAKIRLDEISDRQGVMEQTG